jgi:hypothetical protein
MLRRLQLWNKGQMNGFKYEQGRLPARVFLMQWQEKTQQNIKI